MSEISNLLILPHLRVQNANAISAPLTWGFPAMSAFVGLMHAIERTIDSEVDLVFHGIGVICHDYQTQTYSQLVSKGVYNERFCLTRNPAEHKKHVKADGSIETPAINEEGRMHMEITLVFDVDGGACRVSDEQRAELAHTVDELVHGMRIAGGSVLPRRPNLQLDHQPALEDNPDDEIKRDQHFQKLRRRWLPGFALVLREDLLAERYADLQAQDETSTCLDAWLDFSRLHHECRPDDNGKPVWEIRRRPGWTVPIPVGYGALGSLHDPGTVASARDATTPFRFVESLYSIGEWVSPHRLPRAEALLWYVENESGNGIYRLINDYAPRPQSIQA